jgi:FkbM family methyltransferase
MTAIFDEAPISVNAYRIYSDRIYPNIEHVRGTTRLHNLLKEISLKSILSDTGDGCRLDILKQEPVFQEKLDSKYVFMETDYLEHLLRATEEANVFCDVGGYHGFYSLVSNSEKSIVFEADPTNAERIRQNLELNPDRDIELVEKAVWSSETTLQFEAEASGTSHVSENGIEIESVTLDSFFENTEDPDVVKIDVEGAEGHVLEGAKQVMERSKPTIFLEIHLKGRTDSFGYSKKELYSVLDSFGYEFVFSENRGGEKLVIFK